MRNNIKSGKIIIINSNRVQYKSIKIKDRLAPFCGY